MMRKILETGKEDLNCGCSLNKSTSTRISTLINKVYRVHLKTFQMFENRINLIIGWICDQKMQCLVDSRKTEVFL